MVFDANHKTSFKPFFSSTVQTAGHFISSVIFACCIMYTVIGPLNGIKQGC